MRHRDADSPCRPGDEGPIHVLVVEDNEGFSYFLKDVLTRQVVRPFQVEHAGDLATALRMLKTTLPDVILLDLALPDSLGFDTFNKIHAHARQRPIIVLTALDDDEVSMHAMRDGAQDYLVKDEVDRNLLVRSIRYAIERARAESALRDLSGRLLQLQDEERRRIARELHDVTAQNLAALGMNLSALLTILEDTTQRSHALLREGAETVAGHDEDALESLASILTDLSTLGAETESRADGLLRDCMTFVEQCSRELRTMSYLLHPPLLDELGLSDAVRDYADGFAVRSGIRVDLELPERMGRLGRETEMALFRLMQESLTNIHRHSGSKTASICIRKDKGDILLEVSDTGCGVSADALSSKRQGATTVGVGIAGMRQRVRQLGGMLNVERTDSGTRVTASLPLGGNNA